MQLAVMGEGARRFFGYYRVTTGHRRRTPNALSLNLNRVLNLEHKLSLEFENC